MELHGLRDRLPRLRSTQSAEAELALIRAQIGRMESRYAAALPAGRLADAEFQVFSQFGEDGLIQHLITHVPIEHEVFVEFGVADYRESNTRFLLVNDNWRGLVIDGGDAHRAFLRRSGLDWRHEIDAVTAFVDRDNIDGIIRGAGVEGDIGLLSIDVDGNDLWLLEAIEVVSPRILIVEYNATFGPDAAVTIPYDAGFRRTAAHPSNLYWGASLRALEIVAARRGYRLVAGNAAGNNAFFVREDVAGALPAVAAGDAWRPSRFRESRDAAGALTYVSALEDRLRIIRGGRLWDVEAQRETTVAQRFGV